MRLTKKVNCAIAIKPGKMCELLMLRYTRSGNYIACIALSIVEEETTDLCSASHSRKTIKCIVFRDVKVNRVAKKMRCRIWHLSKSSLSPKPSASVLIRKRNAWRLSRVNLSLVLPCVTVGCKQRFYIVHRAVRKSAPNP